MHDMNTFEKCPVWSLKPRRAVLMVLIGAFAIASCSEHKRVVFEDYCWKQKRKIPAKERFRDVLLNILNNRSTYEKRFDDQGGVHFFKYLDEKREESGSLTNSQIAERYISEFPACCVQQTPTYQRENWPEDAYVDGGGWVVDVRIWRSMPPPQNPGKRPDQFVRAVDACDDDIRYRGGINGIFE